MDKFLVFSLSLDDQAFLERHRSGKFEASLLKQVPLHELDRARQILKRIGIKNRTKFRGPRTHSIYTTLKKDATHAALYERSKYA
jgi:hypothetical protein